MWCLRSLRTHITQRPLVQSRRWVLRLSSFGRHPFLRGQLERSLRCAVRNSYARGCRQLEELHRREGGTVSYRWDWTIRGEERTLGNGQRGSRDVAVAPWKSPMMAWSTVCDDYFRVADHTSTILSSHCGFGGTTTVGSLKIGLRMRVPARGAWMMRVH